MANGNGVSWKPVLLLLGSTIAVCITVVWLLLGTHAQQPHAGAVHRDEFKILQQDVRDLRAEQSAGFREMRDLILRDGGD